MNNTTETVIAWSSGSGEVKGGGKVSKKDFPSFVLHMKASPHKTKPWRSRRGCETLIKPE